MRSGNGAFNSIVPDPATTLLIRAIDRSICRKVDRLDEIDNPIVLDPGIGIFGEFHDPIDSTRARRNYLDGQQYVRGSKSRPIVVDGNLRDDQHIRGPDRRRRIGVDDDL
jgi:hypothetical protein